MKQTLIVEQFDNGITIKSEGKQVFKVVENAKEILTSLRYGCKTTMI